MINARTIWYTPLFSDGVRKQGRLLWGWGWSADEYGMGKIKSQQGDLDV